MTFDAGTVFAGYRIVRLLGSGGMGEVYLATHPRLPRNDALKVLAPHYSGNDEFPATVQSRGRHRLGSGSSEHRQDLRPW